MPVYEMTLEEKSLDQMHLDKMSVDKSGFYVKAINLVVQEKYGKIPPYPSYVFILSDKLTYQ